MRRRVRTRKREMSKIYAVYVELRKRSRDLSTSSKVSRVICAKAGLSGHWVSASRLRGLWHLHHGVSLLCSPPRIGREGIVGAGIIKLIGECGMGRYEVVEGKSIRFQNTG